MNKIPVSAEDALTQQPSIAPKEQYGLLNAALPAWLHDLTAGSDSAREFDALTVRLKYIQLDRKYSRHEMKER